MSGAKSGESSSSAPVEARVVASTPVEGIPVAEGIPVSTQFYGQRPPPSGSAPGYLQEPFGAAEHPIGYGHADLGHFDGRVAHPDSRAYSTNLFDCAEDPRSCAYGALCPVCQISETADRARAGDCFLTGCVLVGLAQLNHLAPCLGNLAVGAYVSNTANRVALNYGIEEPTDVFTACAFAPCVSCRLAREVKIRTAMGQEPVDVLHQLEMYAQGRLGGVAAPRPHAGMSRDAGTGSRTAAGTGGRDEIVTYTAVVSSPQEYAPALMEPTSPAPPRKS